MKDATARKIIEAALGRMEEVLGRPLPRDPRRLTREAAAEMDKKNPDYVRMADVGLVLGFWDEMLHALRKRPEPTAEELVKYFAQLRSTDLAGFARDVLRGQLRKLPPSPKGIKPVAPD